MQFRRLFPWWRKPAKADPEVVAAAIKQVADTVAQATAAVTSASQSVTEDDVANKTIAVPEFTELADVEKMFGNVVWAWEEISEFLNDIGRHVQFHHHDPMECDTWCLPSQAVAHLDSLTREQLVVQYVVLLKQHYWTLARGQGADAT